MADTIRVKIAPGCHIPISPHPSGIRDLPALILNFGDELDVTPERMRELLDARLILDPATGRLVPPPQPFESHGVTVTGDGGRTWHSDARNLPAWTPPEQINTREPIKAGNYDPGFNGMVRQWDELTMDPITDAQGRPWPK